MTVQLLSIYMLCHYGSSILHTIIPHLVHVVCNINHSRFNLCMPKIIVLQENICNQQTHDTCFPECSVHLA